MQEPLPACCTAAPLGLGHATCAGAAGLCQPLPGGEEGFPLRRASVPPWGWGRSGLLTGGLRGWVLLCLTAAAAPLFWSACINFKHMSNPIKLSALLERG